MPNDTVVTEDIDIEELAVLVREATGGNMAASEAQQRLEAIATQLAARVVADAAVLRDAREALEAAMPDCMRCRVCDEHSDQVLEAMKSLAKLREAAKHEV